MEGKKTMINFIKMDLDNGIQDKTYEQILRYNDYENLLKLFSKEKKSEYKENVRLDQSMILFDFIFTIVDYDRESKLSTIKLPQLF